MPESQALPMKILVVDDEHEILEIIAESMADSGFEVLTAPSVDVGLEIIVRESARLVLVISDLQMPGQSGLDLRRAMMEGHKHIPFIILSAYINRDTALKGVELKINSFVEKPYDHSRLMKVIESETKDRIEALQEEDELLAGFLTEAGSLVDEIEGLILCLEENPQDGEAIDRIFACAHTIKGTSGYFKPDIVHRFTHRYEDYIAMYKKGVRAIDQQAISILLKGLDTIRGLLGELADRDYKSKAIEPLVTIFESQVDTGTQNEIQQASSRMPSAVKEISKGTDDLRVSISLLNSFMERSGELTVIRNMINKVVRLIEAELPMNANVALLSELLNEMHKTNGQMQDQIVDLRKVPLKQVYKPLLRTMRDLNVQLKKKVSLEVRGEELRIDHSVAEILSKCLIHMVRNAADHGIETSQVRKDLGKPEHGKILITVDANSDLVTVRVKDDGKGIDAQAVKEKALEKQIVSEAEVRKMSEAQLRMLIFRPGFSTAEHLTDVSGRGVGTDMVLKTVTGAGGQIDVYSEKNVGTEFVIQLPVPKSVMIVSSLLVKVQGETLAIPQESVSRVVCLSTEDWAESVCNVEGQACLGTANGLLPIIDTASFLQIPTKNQTSSTAEVTLISVECKGGAFCLKVDEIQDVEDTVVKRMSCGLRSISAYAGATFLGDGRVGLILDIDGIGQELGFDISGTKQASVTSDAPMIEKQKLLLFQAGSRTTYGALESQLFRLEEFKASEVRQSGGQLVALYRGQALPLVGLQEAIESGSLRVRTKNLDGRDRVPVIVVQGATHHLGFVVSQIEDFVEFDPALLGGECEGWRSSQPVVIGDKLVTYIDLLEALKAFVRYKAADPEAPSVEVA